MSRNELITDIAKEIYDSDINLYRGSGWDNEPDHIRAGYMLTAARIVRKMENVVRSIT